MEGAGVPAGTPERVTNCAHPTPWACVLLAGEGRAGSGPLTPLPLLIYLLISLFVSRHGVLAQAPDSASSVLWRALGLQKVRKPRDVVSWPSLPTLSPLQSWSPYLPGSHVSQLQDPCSVFSQEFEIELEGSQSLRILCYEKCYDKTKVNKDNNEIVDKIMGKGQIQVRVQIQPGNQGKAWGAAKRWCRWGRCPSHPPPWSRCLAFCDRFKAGLRKVAQRRDSPLLEMSSYSSPRYPCMPGS